MTKTNKLILINPSDLDIGEIMGYKPDKSSARIKNLYTHTSLAAPILASSKHELILPINSTNYTYIDNFIASKLNLYYGVDLSKSNIVSIDATKKYNVELNPVATTGTLWVYKTWIEANVMANANNPGIKYYYYN